MNPKPSPPIRILGRALPGRRRQVSTASASSDAPRREFISSTEPSRMETSAPRRISFISPGAPGIGEVAMWVQGITG